MNIKNTFEISLNDAINLIKNLSYSLETNNTFSFKIREHEASIEANDPLELSLSISPNSFTMEFKWSEKEILPSAEPTTDNVDWRAEFDRDVADAGYPIEETVDPSFHPYVREVKLDDETEISQPPSATPEITSSMSVPNRAFVEQLMLNTTTIPNEYGDWHSAFNHEDTKNIWEEIKIDSELENKKWEPTEDIGAPGMPTSTSRRTPKKENKGTDLFSSLESLDQKKSRGSKPKKRATIPSAPKPTMPKAPSPKSSIPKAPSPKSSIPKAPSLKSSIPKAPSPKSSIPKAPSPKSSIPQVKKGASKRSTIPSPTPINPLFSGASVKPVADIDPDDVAEWKEPSREDITTNDEWVKPSEILKKKKINEIKKRKPPTPPDKKTNKDQKKDKKKGWSNW